MHAQGTGVENSSGFRTVTRVQFKLGYRQCLTRNTPKWSAHFEHSELSLRGDKTLKATVSFHQLARIQRWLKGLIVSFPGSRVSTQPQLRNFVTHQPERLKAGNTVGIHETRLPSVQYRHDLLRSLEYCSPTDKRRDRYQPTT